MGGWGGRRPGAGRKPKPTALKVLEGNPGRRPLPRREPQPTVGSTVCPTWLPDEGKAEWKRVAPRLLRLGLLTELDRAALALYCDAWAQYARASAFIREHGHTYTNSRGKEVQYPQVGIAASAAVQLRGWCAEFGMTPSSRSRMQVAPQTETIDDMEALLAKTQQGGDETNAVR